MGSVKMNLAMIEKIVGRMSQKQKRNAASLIDAMNAYGGRKGMLQPHRLAQFLAQILHESAAFNYDREIWGPTPAQKRYEGRRDLGNVKPGDGSKFRGRGPIQITGRANTREFRDWCRKFMADTGIEVPDFEKTPELMNTDPWEGLGPIWYWDTRGLNRYADQGDIEMVTKRINGGLNGYQDRLDWYSKVALVILGYGRGDVSGFQKDAGMTVDGIAGPRTRASMHKRLVAMSSRASLAADVAIAPVYDEKKVVPQEIEDTAKRKTGVWGWATGIGGSIGTSIAGVLGVEWQTVAVIGISALIALVIIILLRSQIASAIREISNAVEDDA